MGKFYEFYHMDAEVGVKELGLIYMKVIISDFNKQCILSWRRHISYNSQAGL